MLYKEILEMKMKAYIDVENSHTKDVVTYECPVLEFNEKDEIKFDISHLNNNEIESLKLAISEKPELNYIDIEMFYIYDDKIPYFGPDYDFSIINKLLIAKYNRKKYPRK